MVSRPVAPKTSQIDEDIQASPDDVSSDASDAALGQARQQLLDQIWCTEEKELCPCTSRSFPADHCAQRKPKQQRTSSVLEAKVVNKAHPSMVWVGIKDEEMGHLSHSKRALSEEGCLAGIPGAIAVCPGMGAGEDETSFSFSSSEDLQDVLGFSGPPVMAVTVDEDIAEIEERVRCLILEEAVEASEVIPTPHTPHACICCICCRQKWYLLLAVALVPWILGAAGLLWLLAIRYIVN